MNIRNLASALAIAAASLTACGGDETVASQSARAFREAQQKGVPIGGDGHGGHRAVPAGDAAPTPVDHSTMDHSTMDHAATDHAAMGHAATNHAAMPHSGTDHAAMGHAPAASAEQHGEHATMDHSPTQHTPAAHAQMDHDRMPGMQHGAHAAAVQPPVIDVPKTSREIAAIDPAATLDPDPLDAPAPLAVAEATKAANNVPDGDVRHIVPGTDRENPPTPRPAVDTAHESHNP